MAGQRAGWIGGDAIFVIEPVEEALGAQHGIEHLMIFDGVEEEFRLYPIVVLGNLGLVSLRGIARMDGKRARTAFAVQPRAWISTKR